MLGGNLLDIVEDEDHFDLPELEPLPQLANWLVPVLPVLAVLGPLSITSSRWLHHVDPPVVQSCIQ